MEEITFETARELGILKDNSLEFAYKSVEGCSILSPATDRAFESAYRARRKEVEEENRIVYFQGEPLKVV